MKLIAQLSSWIFMPLLTPMYALVTVLFVQSNNPYCYYQECLYTLPEQGKWALIYMFSLFLVLLPGLSYFIMFNWKIIETPEMESRKERTYPIVVMFMYSVVLYVSLLINSPARMPVFILSFALSGALVTAVFLGLNFWRKISIHAGAAGIATGFVLVYTLQHTYYSMYPIMAFILMSGLVMTSRLYLNRHSVSEVAIGWFTGLIITFFTVYLY